MSDNYFRYLFTKIRYKEMAGLFEKILRQEHDRLNTYDTFI